LVLRRLTECLGRDRTKHQVAEVTSLGLVQMTRKRVGEGLLEAFSETCEVCHGRGVIIHSEPVAKGASSGGSDDDGEAKSAKPRRRRGGKSANDEAEPDVDPAVTLEQRNKALAAMSAIHRAAHANGETTDDQLALELEAVEAVLAGGEVDAEQVAAEVLDSDARPDPTAEAVEAVAVVETVASFAPAEAEPVVEPVVEQVAGLDEPSPNGAVDPALATAAPVKAARPRRRRAASRPAGPPTTG
jgi:ribonuclease E